MTIRLCKTALVATVALFFALVAFGNITDYGTNWPFVVHVLAMDTIFPDSTVKWRALNSLTAAAIAYGGIIAWQTVTAIVLTIAAARLAVGCRSAAAFAAGRKLAVAGLTMGLLLYGLGFIVIGGEWFAMWQSHTWNGLPAAERFFLLGGIVLLIMLAPDE